MNISGASRIIGAMLAAAIAGSATCVNAQTVVGAPADVAVQRVADAVSPPRNRPDRAVIRDVRRRPQTRAGYG